MADEVQVHLSVRDELSAEITDATKKAARLESQLRQIGDATDDRAKRDIEQLSRELDDTYRETKRLTWTLGKLDDSLDRVAASSRTATTRTSQLNREMSAGSRRGSTMVAGWGKMAGAFAAVTGAVAASAGAFQFLASSVNEARAARKAAAQTAAVMRSMGRTEAPKTINKMIDSLSELSGIDDDEIRSMTNMLFTFGNVTGKTFEKANALALDVSTAFGKDLSSSAVMVGKALNDPTKGLSALSRVGVQFTKQQTEQVKAMMEVGNIAGAQKIILKELERQVGGSAEAQADSIGKAQVAWGNLKEAIGEVILSVGTGGADITESINTVTRWIKRNKGEIVAFFQTVLSVIYKWISVWLKWESIVLKGIGYVVGGIATVLTAMSLLDPSMRPAADAARDLANKFGEVSAGADKASKFFDKMSEKSSAAARKTQNLKVALDKVGVAVDNLNRKKVNNLLRDTQIPGVNSQGGVPVSGDTSVGMGVGSLGAAGLQAAHAMYSGALGGHSITSGMRNYNLGSVHSDHRYGRAMDVQGPRLGAYAQVVRRNGGYAAMHGTGGNRHLHVVPQTRKPVPSRGGNSFHADVTVVNPNADMDIESAVARGLRAAARQTRERS